MQLVGHIQLYFGHWRYTTSNIFTSLPITTRLLRWHGGGVFLLFKSIKTTAVLGFGHFECGCRNGSGVAVASHPNWRLAWQKDQPDIIRQAILLCALCGLGNHRYKASDGCIWVTISYAETHAQTIWLQQLCGTGHCLLASHHGRSKHN